LGVVPQAPVQLLRRGAQVNHRAALVQVLPIQRPQHGAAPGGEHQTLLVARRRQLVKHLLFDVAERGFSVLLKKGTDRHADPLFEHHVGVQKASSESSGQLAPDGGLSTSGQTNQRYTIQTRHIDQRRAPFSETTLGVRKISNSERLEDFAVLRNSAPNTGMSPSSGTFCVWLFSC